MQVVVALLKSYGISRVIASPGTTNLTFVASLQHDSFFKVYSAPEGTVGCLYGSRHGRRERRAGCDHVHRSHSLSQLSSGVDGSILSQTAGYSHHRNASARLNRTACATGHRPQLVKPKDAATYSVHIPIVKDNADYTFAVLKTNEALHHLSKSGGGGWCISTSRHLTILISR